MTRARDAGLACGRLKPGARNLITDVPGVAVGHLTRDEGAIQTGVTARCNGGKFNRRVPGRRGRLAGRETGFVMEGLSETVGWKNLIRATLHAWRGVGHQKWWWFSSSAWRVAVLCSWLSHHWSARPGVVKPGPPQA